MHLVIYTLSFLWMYYSLHNLAIGSYRILIILHSPYILSIMYEWVEFFFMSAQSWFGPLSGLSHSRGPKERRSHTRFKSTPSSHRGFERLKICRNRLSHPSPTFLSLTLFLSYSPFLLLYLSICLCISIALILFLWHVFFLSLSLYKARLQGLAWRCFKVKAYSYVVRLLD